MKPEDRKDAYREIIHRIEAVRLALDLNKSRFSAEIGLKAQTYNNFIGAQGSKPSVDLIYGVARRFQVDLHWLLFEEGGMWRDDAQIAAAAAAASNPHALATNRAVLDRLEAMGNQVTQLAQRVERLESPPALPPAQPAAESGGGAA